MYRLKISIETNHFISVIIARIRRMGEGNIFSLFTLAGRGGGGMYPISGISRGGGYPVPGLGGGIPSQVWVGGYPISGLGRGVPHLRSG